MNRGATALLCAALLTVAAVASVAGPAAADSHDGGTSVYPVSGCPNGEFTNGVVETVEAEHSGLEATVCSERHTYVNESAGLNGTVAFAPRLTNVMTEATNVTVTLVVNGTVRDTATVSVGAGEAVSGDPADPADPLTLTATFSGAGERNVTVAGVNATVDVRDPDVCAAAAPDTREVWLNPPQDLPGGDQCEDIDGDGSEEFGDLIDLAFWPLDEIDYVEPWDEDGDGEVGFDDIVRRAFRIGVNR